MCESEIEIWLIGRTLIAWLIFNELKESLLCKLELSIFFLINKIAAAPMHEGGLAYDVWCAKNIRLVTVIKVSDYKMFWAAR